MAADEGGWTVASQKSEKHRRFLLAYQVRTENAENARPLKHCRGIA